MNCYLDGRNQAISFGKIGIWITGYIKNDTLLRSFRTMKIPTEGKKSSECFSPQQSYICKELSVELWCTKQVVFKTLWTWMSTCVIQVHNLSILAFLSFRIPIQQKKTDNWINYSSTTSKTLLIATLMAEFKPEFFENNQLKYQDNPKSIAFFAVFAVSRYRRQNKFFLLSSLLQAKSCRLNPWCTKSIR